MTIRRIAVFQDATLEMTYIREKSYSEADVRLTQFVEVDFPPLEADPAIIQEQAARIDREIERVRERTEKTVMALNNQKTKVLSTVFAS